MRIPSPTPERMAEARRKLFQPCRTCGKALESHSWWRLASAVLGSDSGMAATLASLVEARSWEQAALVQEWEATQDEREYYLVRCPDSKAVSLVTVVAMADMWSDDYVESSEILGDEDSSTLTAIVGDRWKPF